MVVGICCDRPRGGDFLWIDYLRVPANTAYVSEENGRISVIYLRTLEAGRRVQLNDIAPRGLAITSDGRYLIPANKNTGDLAVHRVCVW